MNQKFRNLFLALVLPLCSFTRYWRNLQDDYSGMNMLWGTSVTIILVICLYLLLEKKIERFSPAWSVGIGIGMFFLAIGFSMSLSDVRPDVYIAWGEYMRFFGLWITGIFAMMPKEYKPYKWSFFKRMRPIENAKEASN